VRLMDEQGGPMEKLIAKLDPADVKTLFEFMRYVWRKKQNEGPVPTTPLVSSSPLSPSTSTPETPSPSSDSEYTSDRLAHRDRHVRLQACSFSN
jgi:hypothetical protein